MCKIKKKFFIIFPIIIFIISCGKSGNIDENIVTPVVEPSKPIVVVNGETPITSVPLGGEEFSNLEYIKCADTKIPDILDETNKNIILDGDLSDWDKNSFTLRDESLDSDPSYDLTEIKINKGTKYLYLAIKRNQITKSKIYLEFGGVSSKNSKLIQKVSRTLRVGENLVEEYVSNWEPLSQDQSSYVLSDQYYEIAINNRILSEVFSWPLWWIRIYTEDENSGLMADTTATRYFKGEFNTELIPTNMTQCILWPESSKPLTINQIQIGSDKISETKVTFEVLRGTFQKIKQFLGKNVFFPSEISILSAEMTGIPDFIPLFTDSDKDHSKINDSFIDSKLIEKTTLSAFPVHDFYNFTGKKILELIIWEHLPFKSKLKEALLIALSDQFQREVLSESYWLHHFPIAPELLHKVYTENGKNLNKVKFDVDNKTDWFGHILAITLSKSAILDAIFAMKKSELFLENFEELFFENLVEKNQDHKIHELIDQLKEVWLQSPSFDNLGKFSTKDDDNDGVWNLLEDTFNTSRTSNDTDGDGWSDFAEKIEKTSPTDKSSKPFLIFNDGIFSDWLELIPQKINLDAGAKGLCAEGGEITKYSSLWSQQNIMVGAYTDHFVSDNKTEWQIEIKDEMNKVGWVILSASNSRIFRVYDQKTQSLRKVVFQPFTYEGNSVEWNIPLKILRSYTKEEMDKKSLFIKVATVRVGTKTTDFCDETSWFNPTIIN